MQLMEWEGQRVAYDGFHDCITFRVRGRLPGEKEKMLGKLDGAIKVWKEKEPVFAWAERIPGRSDPERVTGGMRNHQKV